MWEPLKIHFGGQANLFDSGRRQAKAALASTKADSPSLPEHNPDLSGLLTAQKQLLELPLKQFIRVFEEFFDEVEELGRFGAVDDFVIDR